MKISNLISKLKLACIFLFLVNLSHAQLNNYHKTYMEIGYVGGMQNNNSYLGGVTGAIGTFFKVKGRPASIDIRVKELYISNPDRQGTLISFSYRISIVKGLFFGIGGAHSHSVMMNEFMIHPVSSMGGANPTILHSSGFNTEIGYNFNSFIKNKYLGIYPTINVAYSHLFGYHYSMPYVTLCAGFRIGFNQWNN